MSGRQRFAVVGDHVVFVAVDDAHGAELWSTDGTPAGTRLLHDVIPGPESLDPEFLALVDDALIFGARHGTDAGLWRSDGTAAGTERIGAAAPIRPPVPVGDGLVFKALGDTGGYEIWHTDGTAADTQRVTDSAFGDIVAFDNAAYYLAGVDGGCVLKRTGGTQATTSEVLQINAPREALGGSCLGEMAVAGGRIFFAAEDGHGGEPWRSDGTAAGTQLVRDVRDGSTSAEARSLLDLHGRLLFLADDDQRYGPELWTSDGTSAGTRLFLDPPLSNAWEIFAALGDRVLFRQSPSYPRLWATDGTMDGTGPLTASDVHESPTIAGGLAFFSTATLAGELSVWRTDGTPAGTVRLRELRTLSADPIGVDLGGRLLFFADDEHHGVEPWRSDGTADGTVQIADINPGPDGSAARSLLARWRDRAFFAADDGQHGSELWSTDGTQPGTVLVGDLNPGPAGSELDALTATADELFFVATDGSSGRELWVSDGTDGGTKRVADIDPGAEGAEPRELTPVNGVVVFAAFDPDAGVELWRSDGTLEGTVLVADIKLGPASSFPTGFHAAGDHVYFVAHDGRHGWEVWRTDGSRAGTELAGDLNVGGASAFFTVLGADRRRVPAPAFAAVDSAVLFVADDGQHGRELWKSGAGTAALLADVAPGAVSSDPREPTVAGGHIFFTADNEATGRELWAVNRAEVGATCVCDCAGVWRVAVADLVTGVRIALGQLPVATCPAVDANGDATATVDELLSGVVNALEGCKALVHTRPSPHPIESATPLLARTPRPTPTRGPIGDCRRTGCFGEVCADHDVHLPYEYCFLGPEYDCLETAPCELVADRCVFVVRAGGVAHRCFAGLGYCVLDEDCNVGEICEQQDDFRVDDHPVLVFGLCRPADG